MTPHFVRRMRGLGFEPRKEPTNWFIKISYPFNLKALNKLF